MIRQHPNYTPGSCNPITDPYNAPRYVPAGKEPAQLTRKEYKRILREMKQTAKEACKSQESARAFLRKVGIITKSGKLAKPYR